MSQYRRSMWDTIRPYWNDPDASDGYKQTHLRELGYDWKPGDPPPWDTVGEVYLDDDRPGKRQRSARGLDYTCTECGEVIPNGRSFSALTCSPACARERKTRLQRERRKCSNR